MLCCSCIQAVRQRPGQVRFSHTFSCACWCSGKLAAFVPAGLCLNGRQQELHACSAVLAVFSWSLHCRRCSPSLQDLAVSLQHLSDLVSPGSCCPTLGRPWYSLSFGSFRNALSVLLLKIHALVLMVSTHSSMDFFVEMAFNSTHASHNNVCVLIPYPVVNQPINSTLSCLFSMTRSH